MERKIPFVAVAAGDVALLLFCLHSPPPIMPLLVTENIRADGGVVTGGILK